MRYPCSGSDRAHRAAGDEWERSVDRVLRAGPAVAEAALSDNGSLIQDRDDGLIQDHLAECRCVVTD